MEFCCVLGERNSGLSQLRDVILTNLAEQLQNNRFGSDEDDHYRWHQLCYSASLFFVFFLILNLNVFDECLSLVIANGVISMLNLKRLDQLKDNKFYSW